MLESIACWLTRNGVCQFVVTLWRRVAWASWAPFPHVGALAALDPCKRVGVYTIEQGVYMCAEQLHMATCVLMCRLWRWLHFHFHIHVPWQQQVSQPCASGCILTH